MTDKLKAALEKIMIEKALSYSDAHQEVAYMLGFTAAQELLLPLVADLVERIEGSIKASYWQMNKEYLADESIERFRTELLSSLQRFGDLK